MRSLYLSLVGALSLSACGPVENGGFSMQVDTTKAGVIAEDVTRACLSLYPGQNSCEVIRLSAVGGAYISQVQVTGGTPEAQSSILDVEPGFYTAVVWAFNAENSPIGFGCNPKEVSIDPGKRSEVIVELAPNPSPERGIPCGLP